MDKSPIGKNNKLLDRARRLRREMTAQEKHLWYDYLRKYPIKIYKQRIVGNYIVDFYCASARLVIEIDGGHHFTENGRTDDFYRDSYMKSLGIVVLRFTNNDIDNHFYDVCARIDAKISAQLS